MADDEATQPATQQVLDPRRLGRNNSGLSGNDAADVLCILHPTSPASMKVIEDMAQIAPEFILVDSSFSTYSIDDRKDIEEQETIIMSHKGHSGHDLVLRLSTQPRQPKLGFTFGRNATMADVVFGRDSGKRVSNSHFRIYVNEGGVLMLEDTSTNGTFVDDILLRGKDGRFKKRMMLCSGSTIAVQNTINHRAEEWIRFVVRIPNRDGHLDRYQKNLEAFFIRCYGEDAAKREVLERMGHQFGGKSMQWSGGEHYNVIGQLGKGAFATVYRIATKMDGRVFAAKELEKKRFVKNGQLDKKIDNEMQIMKGLKHPNIVDFVDYHDHEAHIYIIMEFVPLGDLQGYLTIHNTMNEATAKTMTRQVLDALHYLHRQNITHRDIKPDNILIAKLDPFLVKLSDFGLSKVVTHNETFLKTFCGTLLYCAPEVFPDFGPDRVKGTKRRRGVSQKFHSYSSSVDIWSYAAVLWFALCNKPPFEGIADATGQAMYNNIMSTRLDTTPLVNEKVSKDCIDLLIMMLQTDPSIRYNERECFQHRWLNDGSALPDDFGLNSIVEEEEDFSETGEQLSQLSIHELADLEEVPDEEVDVDDEDFEFIMDARQSKKIRVDPLFPSNQVRDRDGDSSVDASFVEDRLMADIDDESFKMMPQKARPRLFGEIGQSALQSSGVLSVHAAAALSKEGSTTEDSTPGTRSDDDKHNPPTRQKHGLDGALSSPSLLGAESMVREMQVTSPRSPNSSSHSPKEPATPKTPDVPQHSSLELDSNLSEETPKANIPSLKRHISLPKGPSFYWVPEDPSTHNLEYASKVSGIDFIAEAAATERAARATTNPLPDTIRVSADEVAQSDPQTVKSFPASQQQTDVKFKPPARRLGKLIATSDSFNPAIVIWIERNKTSWRRLPECTYRYEDKLDTRVPKKAFTLWWASTESDESVDALSQEGKDWTKLEGLHAGIFTCAKSGIYVNGVLLKQNDEKGRALFGRLHTGDIIQVYQSQKNFEWLKFKCEFYYGAGKEPRPPGETFKVQRSDQQLNL